MEKAFQDQMVDNRCWGCGAGNPGGFRLKSYWDGDVAVGTWRARPEHAAGSREFLNGGVGATLLDCHAVSTAMADAYRQEDREIGSDPQIWFVTSSMTVNYLRPTPLGAELSLRATVVQRRDRLTVIDCALEAEGKERISARVEAVRVPESWRLSTSG